MDFGTFETLAIETSEGVATITINRPEALNALSTKVVEELAKVCEVLNQLGGTGTSSGLGTEAADDGAWPVRGVILIGAGGRAFAAGADIREMMTMSQDQGDFYARSMHAVTLAFETLPVPVIACVDGYALGGGCELALAADFIYATERAQFGQPEVNLGLVPGFGGTVRLQQRIGLGMARELIYTGRQIDAGEAQRLGLVNRVLPTREELLAAAAGTIHEIATKAPTAVALAKRSINQSTGRPTAEGLNIEATSFRAAFATEDKQEGTAAFIEKRGPVFPGR